jgi:hypothetical protein
MACSFEKEQRMQHFPLNGETERPARRSARDESVAIPNTEEHRDQDEIDATVDWLAHLAAGRIEVK